MPTPTNTETRTRPVSLLKQEISCRRDHLRALTHEGVILARNGRREELQVSVELAQKENQEVLRLERELARLGDVHAD